MPKGYIVVGPERSGTRMLTRAIISTGVFGDYTHEQRLDDLDFKDIIGDIVIRRSIPHKGKYPGLSSLIYNMEKSGREVFPLIIIRKWKGIQGSRQRLGWANPSIAKAVTYAYELFTVDDFLEPIFVNYEHFVELPEVRKMIFKRLGLPEPKMHFYNANDKYHA